ncbi:MAG TPA: PilN domain-containing protein, partial [Armatimonadota bacterium]|nr:PilN domain-containing protein [Armatimonadota bacterium]
VGAARLAMSLPGSDCAVKTASLPPAAPAELARVVRFEAETQFPLPLPEMAWHYALTPGPDGRPHAVIAGARGTAVEERLLLARESGRACALLLPAPLAAAGAVRHPDGPHLLVMAGAKWSDLCLYDGDRLLNCRSVLAGAPATDGWAARIAREARPWLTGAAGPAQALLAGAEAGAEALTDALGIPVHRATPWQAVRDPHGFQQELPDPPGAFTTAIGLALAARGAAGLNLLPARVTRTRAERARLAWALAALLLIAVVLATFAYQGHQRLAASRAALRRVEAEALAAQRAVPPSPGGGLLAAQQVTEALAAPASRPLELLRALSATLPEPVTLSDFSYDRGKGVLTLKGHADTSATVADAVRALGAVSGVTRAMLDATTADSDGKGYTFQLTCLLAVAEDPTVTRAPGRVAEGRR